MITQSQVEEIIASLAVIIALLAIVIGVDWLAYLFIVKAIFDFGCMTYRAFQKKKEEK
jgi:hypothetical protein